MQLPVIRPSRLSDLSALVELTEASGWGITSLPRSTKLLEKRLHTSEKAFQEQLTIPNHETYLFCLEWEGRVIGTSGIISRIGGTEPFFGYHIRHEPQRSSYIGIDTHIPVLHFLHTRKKPTEIASLFLAPAHRHGSSFGKLLSLSRFLFIASFKNRFASIVIAELRGVNHNGLSPFWEAIGRHFFHMDFSKADLLRSEYPACIEEIFPKHPFYVELLPKSAQDAIGVTHTETLAALKLLEKQGFKKSQSIDLFDAGPHVYAPTDEIHAVNESRECLVVGLKEEITDQPKTIIANTQLDFRATLAPLTLLNEGAILHPAIAASLNTPIGSTIRYYSHSLIFP